MSDVSVESGPEAQESQAPPKISDASAAPASSPVDTKELAKSVAELLEPRFQAIERASQSLKDKRLAKLETSVEEIATRFKIDPVELANYEREKKIERLLERDEVRQEVGPSWQDRWQAGSEEILRTAAEDFGVKIDRNDEEFLAIQRGQYASEGAALAAVTKLAARRLKQGSVAASAVAGEGTGKLPVSDTLESARKAVADARKQGLPVAELRKRNEALKEAMRA